MVTVLVPVWLVLELVAVIVYEPGGSLLKLAAPSLLITSGGGLTSGTALPGEPMLAR